MVEFTTAPVESPAALRKTFFHLSKLPQPGVKETLIDCAVVPSESIAPSTEADAACAVEMMMAGNIADVGSSGTSVSHAVNASLSARSKDY